MASSLHVQRVTRRFGSVAAVDGVDLTVRGGEFLGLLGPSGCGKTTLLRLIAGFLIPDEGRILTDERDITALPPFARNLGVVFQNYALFPHMTAAENVGYGLKVRGVSKAEATTRIRQALERVGLAQAEDKFPAQLSGGMQQRVALARAMVIEPAILLLDEPLSALDKNLREEMQVELRLLQQRVGITTVFVTHDQEEAMTLSDRIAVMQAGKIRQLGAPSEVYRRPTSEFVATFLGTTNILEGVAVGADVVEIAGVRFGLRAEGMPEAGRVRVAVRPESVRLAPGEAGEGPGLPGVVGDVLFQGHRLIVLFKADAGFELRAFVAPGDWALAKGQRAFANWPAGEAGVLVD